MQEEAKKAEKSSFVRRLLSGIVLFVTVVAAVLISRYAFLALLLSICVGSLIEFYRIARLKGAEPQKWFGIAVAATIIIYAFRLSMLEPLSLLVSAGPVVLIGGAILVATTAIIELFRGKENPLVNMATTLLGILYVGLPLSMLCILSVWGATGSSAGTLISETSYTPWMILSFIFVIWANDIGAYLVGMPLGKHKMFPRISPKKSWEGFFGGLVASVGIAILCGWLMGHDLLLWLGIGIVTVVFGVLGDLVESMLKRSAGIKDSGTTMPGHGGWLDRFDALLLATPFVFVYFIIFALA